MLPVELIPIQGTLVLRARGSELLILPQHIRELKSLVQAKDFTDYFLQSALINRPARKLFEAWLRKDTSLWKRIYTMVQKEMEISEEAMGTEAEPKAEAKAPTSAKVAAPSTAKPKADTKVIAVEEVEAEEEEDEAPKKIATAKKATKASVSKDPKATTKKVANAKPAAAATKKTASKAAVAKKPAAKKAAKKSSK